MFTASHNPAQYNGAKLCLPGAKPVGEDTGLLEIKAMTAAGLPPADGTPGGREQLDLLRQFGDHVRSFVDPQVLRPLKVVADTANGMGGLVVPVVFEGLPFELEVLFGELDGTFPNHPADPIQPENLRDLQARVLDTGADVGLAFDGDADRVFVVDDLGEPLSGSVTTAIVAVGVLEKHPGSTILHNCICSKAVPEVVREHGRHPGAHPGRPQLHQGGHGRHRRRLRGRALGPLLLPGQLAGRLRLDRRARAPRAALQGGRAAVRAARALRPLRRLRRDQLRGRRSPGGDRRGGRGLPGRGAGSPRRPHRRPRRLVVQPAPVEHRAAAPTEPRGRRSGILCDARVDELAVAPHHQGDH